MRKWWLTVVPVVIAVALFGGTALAASVGDLVTYRTATSSSNLAVVGRVVTGTTVDLVVFSDGQNWGDSGAPWGVPTITYLSVTLGTGIGQYQPTTVIADTAAAAGFATQGYVNGQGFATTAFVTGQGYASTSFVSSQNYATQSFVTSQGYATTTYVDGLAPNYLGIPTAPVATGMALNGPGVQMSATRPTAVLVRGRASQVSTLAAGQAFTVELRCDSNATPTTVVDDDEGSFTQALGLTVTLTDVDGWKLSTISRPGEFCRVVTTGTATMTLRSATKQTL